MTESIGYRTIFFRVENLSPSSTLDLLHDYQVYNHRMLTTMVEDVAVKSIFGTPSSFLAALGRRAIFNLFLITCACSLMASLNARAEPDAILNSAPDAKPATAAPASGTTPENRKSRSVELNTGNSIRLNYGLQLLE